MPTFKVDEVQTPSTSLPPVEWEKVVSKFCNRAKIEAQSPPTNGRIPVACFESNGFVGAVHTAYDNHYPLVLSPDHIWMCIVQGFATHVNQNAENLRNLFVEHEGKKTIIVRRDDFVKGSPHNPWPEVFSEFSVQIRSHIGEKTHDLLTPTFTTTSPVEKAAAEIVLMDAFKEYFSYRFYTICGIPEITLEGTVDDWKQLRERALGLAQFDLQWWIDSLKPILDQFVAAVEGHVDKSFWSSIYKQTDSSGGPFISGWIVTLFPYMDTRRNHWLKYSWQDWKSRMTESRFGHGATTDSLPPGVTTTPFVWEYLGQDFEMHFYAGFIGVSQDPVTLSIHPEIGWAIVADEELEKIKKPPSGRFSYNS